MSEESLRVLLNKVLAENIELHNRNKELQKQIEEQKRIIETNANVSWLARVGHYVSDSTETLYKKIKSLKRTIKQQQTEIQGLKDSKDTWLQTCVALQNSRKSETFVAHLYRLRLENAELQKTISQLMLVPLQKDGPADD